VGRRRHGSQRSDVRAAYREAGTAVPGVRSLLVGDNVGTLTTDFDLIVDVHLAGLPEVEAYAGHPAQKEALALAAAATEYEWTARITHRMASG
jgi:hypothetical protein